jgi:hypothetical protein
MMLADGSTVDVWADSVQGLSGPEDQRHYHFGNLMDIAPDEQCSSPSAEPLQHGCGGPWR